LNSERSTVDEEQAEEANNDEQKATSRLFFFPTAATRENDGKRRGTVARWVGKRAVYWKQQRTEN
jgi:hypothetical protein